MITGLGENYCIPPSNFVTSQIQQSSITQIPQSMYYTPVVYSYQPVYPSYYIYIPASTNNASPIQPDNQLLKPYKNLSSLEKAKMIAPEHSELIDQLSRKDTESFKKVIDSSDLLHTKDFLNVCSALNKKNQNILTPENLKVLAKISGELKDNDLLLSYAININKGEWLSKMLQNQHFSGEDKINAIKPNCGKVYCRNIIKKENLFYNATPEGDALSASNKVTGLFTDDTQFLGHYKLRATGSNGKAIPLKLVEANNYGGRAEYILKSYDGKLEIHRKQFIDKGGFFEQITAKNSSNTDAQVFVDISSPMKDIFDVRKKGVDCNFQNSRKKVETQPETGNSLKTVFANKINDNKTLGVKISADSNPNNPSTLTKGECAENNSLTLKATIAQSNKAENIMNVAVQPIISENAKSPDFKPFVNGKAVQNNEVYDNCNQAALAFKDKKDLSKIELGGDGVFKEDAGKILNKAFEDIDLLTNTLPVNGVDNKYIGAGLPLYSALFGRDSIITAKFLLHFNPEIAKGTLTLLSEFQGKSFEKRLEEEKQKNPNVNVEEFKKYYENKEEAEGKILHELRVGGLADQKKIVHTPYYGTIDATPLWLTLACDYYKWTGDKETIKKLMPNIEKALEWIDKNSKDDNAQINGFLKFKPNGKAEEERALSNQNWKDSGESTKHIIGPDGKLIIPEYPLSYAEVQGYAYEAKKGMAGLYRELGDIKKAEKLENEAGELKKKFNDKFWCKDINFIAMALDGKGNPVKSISSNASQCLTTGIINEDKAKDIEKITMSPELNSGWGIRTLGKSSTAFDEKSYHNGSVWPHEAAIISQGLSKKNSASITKNLLEAISTLPDKRVPELLAGFDRKEDGNKVNLYPDTCSPQAWSSAGIINMPLSCLGIKLVNNKLVLENPELPQGLNNIKINNVKIRNNVVNLNVARTGENNLEIKAFDSKNKPLQVEKSNTQNIYTIDYSKSGSNIDNKKALNAVKPTIPGTVQALGQPVLLYPAQPLQDNYLIVLPS